MSTRRLVIMDISNLIFRAFYAIPHLSTSDGMPVNAVSGVLSMFLKMLSGCRPSHILVAQEAPGKNFREELDERYKAQRPPPPDALKVQFDLIDELLNHLQVKHLSVAGMEADDVIASATEQWKDQVDDVLIMSSDKDLMQLVGGKVFLLDTMKDQTLGRAEVFAKLGVWPEQVADYLAMVGDTSDNVKGLPGVGAKTAAKLLAQYQNLSACLEHGAEVKNKKVQDAILNHAADAQLAYKLVSLVRDMKLPIALDACAYQFDFTPDLSAFLKRLELKQQHKRLEDLEYNLAMAKQLEAGGDAPAASPSPKFTLKIDPSSSSTITAAPAAGENLLVPLKVLSEANLAEFLTAYQHNEFASMAIIWPHDLAEDAYPFGLKSSQLMVGLADATWLIEDPFLEKIWDKLFVAASSSAPEIIASSYKEFWHWAANRGQTLPRPTAEKGKGLPFLDVQQAYYVAGGLGKHDLRTMLKALLPQENDLLQALFKEDEDWALAVKRSKSTSKKVPAAQIDWPLLQQRRGRWACCGLRKMVAVLRKQLVEREVQTIYSDIDLPLMPILASMEREGVKINPAFFAQMEKTLQAQLEDIEKSVKKISEQKEVNLRSPKQVAQLLFTDLGLPIIRQTKTGQSTDSEVLEELAAMELSEVPSLILEFREIDKLLSTYVKALPSLISPQTQRLHTTFNQNVAATGRLSSDHPNLQNIPVRSELGKKIRQGFIARPGCVLLSADYSQIELRLLAHFSGDPVLVKAFQEGVDIHRQTAAEILGVKPEEVSSAERSVAKTVNFGIIYGQSSFGLASTLKISRSAAAEYITRYFAKFGSIKAYLDSLKEFCVQHGFVQTLAGRRRYLPDIHNSNRTIKSMAERMAINAPLQGTAADLIKLAMLKIDQKLQEQNLQSKLLLQVHDELIFEVPDEELKTMQALVKTEMENVFTLKVPLTVSVGWGINWFDLK